MNIESLRPSINPKNVLRTVFAGAIGLASFPGIAMAGGGPAEIRINVNCSDRPAYGMIEMGPHATVYVNARNLNAVPGANPGDGIWLYVGKTYAASEDPREARGMRVVGFNSDANSMTAYMDGFINSIRGQDASVNEEGNPEVQPITFNPHDRVRIALRRGPYTDGLPADTVEIVNAEFPIPGCTAPVAGELS